MAKKTGAIGSTGSKVSGGSSIGQTKSGGRNPKYKAAKTYADVPF